MRPPLRSSLSFKERFATRLADEFKSSPRYKSILAVFQAIDGLKDSDSVGGVMMLMNATAGHCNGTERDRLPDLVRQALKERGLRGQ